MFSLPIFSDNADEALGTTFRWALRAFTGLPSNTPGLPSVPRHTFTSSSILVWPVDTEVSVAFWPSPALTHSPNASGHGCSPIQRIPFTELPCLPSPLNRTHFTISTLKSESLPSSDMSTRSKRPPSRPAPSLTS